MESNSGLIIILGRAIISYPEILRTKMVSGLPQIRPLLIITFQMTFEAVIISKMGNFFILLVNNMKFWAKLHIKLA